MGWQRLLDPPIVQAGHGDGVDEIIFKVVGVGAGDPGDGDYPAGEVGTISEITFPDIFLSGGLHLENPTGRAAAKLAQTERSEMGFLRRRAE